MCTLNNLHYIGTPCINNCLEFKLKRVLIQQRCIHTK